ncbi:hypothetical protein NPIL_682271 [Nephila pilipes]|uniref:Uncharacterized protein n=1 Tax=Nephila pilipes TaxID=299642 RepID=A0A8X6MQH4_NEPPI|nr:hypothetical protein NPIL_682271 [Nephila pilipes]
MSILESQEVFVPGSVLQEPEEKLLCQNAFHPATYPTNEERRRLYLFIGECFCQSSDPQKKTYSETTGWDGNPGSQAIGLSLCPVGLLW